MAVIVPLPDPVAVTVHHGASDVAVHGPLAVTENVVLPAVRATFLFEGVTVSTGVLPACTSVTRIGARPDTVTVMVAVREKMLLLVLYVALIMPLPKPVGVTMHHDMLLCAFQVLLEATLNVVEPEDDVTFLESGETDNVGITPA